MLIYALAGAIAGLAIATRFRFAALIVAHVLALPMTAAFSIGGGGSLGSSVLHFICWSLAAQGGYLIGILTLHHRAKKNATYGDKRRQQARWL